MRTYRLLSGLTQEQLARNVGVAEQVISLYERGVRKPAAVTLARLAQVLGVGLTDAA
jgi:transcriptional regulator with XRE-family HTH domain